MKSVTKFAVTEREIEKIFENAGFGGVFNISEISDGWFNSIFSAEDKNGKKYVLKIAPPKSARVLSHERGMMRSEVEFYRVLGEFSEIKTPKIVFSDFTETVIPTPYFIMEFLGGERLDKANLTPEEKAQAQEETAKILAEFHKIKGEGFGYPQAGLEKNWKDGLAHMVQMLADDAEFFGKNCKIHKKLLNCIDKFGGILENVPSVLVNFDLHAMNMFCERTESGKIKLTVLDLERCFYGDAIGEFVMQNFPQKFEKKRIIKEYNRYADTKITMSREEKIRYNLMAAYLAAICYTERFSRFHGFKKFLNLTYWAGTATYLILKRQAFKELKKVALR